MTYNDNESSGDESLESGIIYDTLGGRYGYNFAIKIIVQAADDHKQIFNTAYKNYLSNYINNTDCPTAGKAWLSLIIPKIPLS
jgi:hypothetical protein